MNFRKLICNQKLIVQIIKLVYFLGKVSDDYGLSRLQLVYKEVNSDKLFKENY